ncbi:unnamed protein product [Microthlaspi erraticum]|uniref:F-box domain-containing protein n=1 Tax=Microthlaspi erraticum TaxID=1685480 RepID=A0A6D2KCJ0_9BRAS|nr:unnamed protein product [Microthlaspi erraticum]
MTTTMSRICCDWSKLCHDVLRSILERLSTKDLHRARSVCSNWYSVVDIKKKPVATDTFVFWDMVDFPLDEDKIDSFYKNVKSCLRKQGYIGRVKVTAFGHRVHSSRMMLESVHSDIMLLRLSSRFARLNYMLMRMIDNAAFCPQSNFMLIIRGMAEEDVQVVPIIKEIKKRGCNVLLGVSDYDDYFDYPLEVQSSCTLWLWENLLKGHGPVPFVSDDEDEDDTSDDEGSSPKRPNLNIN